MSRAYTPTHAEVRARQLGLALYAVSRLPRRTVRELHELSGHSLACIAHGLAAAQEKELVRKAVDAQGQARWSLAWGGR